MKVKRKRVRRWERKLRALLESGTVPPRKPLERLAWVIADMKVRLREGKQ